MSFYQRHTLPSGLRVLVEEIPHVRSVSVGVWIGAGSRHETEAQAGISHLIEHMLFKGTERRTARDIAEEMDAVGGQLNAFTAKEHTCYYARVLDEHFDLALDLLADMLLHSRLDEVELEREQGVVIEEIKMYEDAPDELVHDLFTEAVWPSHPLGRTIVGTEETVRAQRRSDLIAYMERFYHPGNTVIAVAGNVRATEVVEKVARAFAAYTGAGETGASLGASGPPQPAAGRLLRAKDTEQMHICLGAPGVAQEAPEMYPLLVLNTVLGGGPSSRLFQEIRETHGLAYSVYSYLSSYRDCGVWTVYAGTSVERCEDVIEMTLEQLRRLAEAGLPAAELQRAKDQMKGQMMLSLESTSNRMSRLGRSELTLGRVLSPEEVLAKIDAVTEQEAAAVAAKLFEQPLTLTAVGPAVCINKLQHRTFAAGQVRA